MNDIDFIKNGGREVRNPAYNPKTKKGRLQPPTLISDEPIESNASKINSLANTIRTGFSQFGDETKYSRQGVTLNPVNTQEELNRERAENQSAFEQAGNAVVQAVGNEILIGTALGVSNLVDAIANIATKKGENDYTNPFSQYLENVQNDIRDRFEIYQKDPNASWAIGDFGWWASNAVSIASTASMLIPSMGVVKGLSYLGKIANIGSKASRGLAKAYKGISGSIKSVNRLSKSINAGTEIGLNALASRTMENYLEARGVYNDIRDDTLERIKQMSTEEKQSMIERNPELAGKTDEEMVNYIAGKSADETFRNDYAMLLMDIAQFKAIGSLWKGLPNKTATGTLRTENKKAIKSLVGETVENSTKTASKNKWLTDRLDNIKEATKHPMSTIGAIEWSEGFEEAYQGIQTEKGKEVSEMILDPNFTPRTIGSYISDPKIWEQAFWGVLGGVGFQAAGKALGNLYRKAHAKLNKDKLSEQDFNANMTAEEKIRAVEIQGRAAMNKKFVERMQLLNDLKNPDEYREDPITGERLREDGVDVNKSITPEEAEIKKAQTVNDYISNMTMNAVDAGNYDLLKEYVTSGEFDKYFKDAGLELSASDKSFSNQLVEKMEEVNNTYSDALYNILRNTEVDNESVAKIAAREITTEYLSIGQMTENRNKIEDKINDINTADPVLLDNYRRKAISVYVRKKIKDIEKASQEAYNAYTKHQITEQALRQYQKDYNTRTKSLIEYLKVNNPFDEATLSQYNDIIKQYNPNVNASATLGEINKLLQQIEDIVIPDQQGELPKAVTDLVNKQIVLDDAITHKEYILPKTQQDYVERVNDISEQVDILTKKRLNDAAKQVEQYIIKQTDLQKAFDDVMSNNVPELKNALDILKIGYYSTEGYTNSILATVKEEASKRAKEEKKKQEAIVDGKKQAPEKAAEVKQQLDDIESKGQANETPPSTGKSASRSEASATKGEPAKSASKTEAPKTEVKSPEQEATKAALTKEDIKSFDEAAAKDAAKIADAFNIEIDDLAVTKASTEAFNIFRTSRNLFDDALGKDMNSEEVKRIVDLITKSLIEQGTSPGFAPAAATRGLKVALNTISRRLQTRKDTKAEQFKRLADSIATKQDLTGDMAAATKTIPDNELDSVIDNFLKTYAELKDITPLKNQKITINLERLFHDIVYDPDIDIDIDTAFYILYNMKDYMDNPINTKFIFTSRRSFNSMLKNPAEFANAIENVNLEEVQLDSYMHISSKTQKDDGYYAALNSVRAGDEVEVEYLESRHGARNSISFKIGGKEIGYISVVTPNDSNTGYTAYVSDYIGGINYNVTAAGTANTDDLFNEIFKEDGDLWYILNKYRNNLNDSSSKAPTNEEYEQFLNNSVVKDAINKGVIKFPKKWDAASGRVVPKLVTNKQKAQFLMNALHNVVFYNTFAMSMPEYKSSYRNWIRNVYTNYKNTHAIQTQLNANKKVRVKFAGLASVYGMKGRSVQTIINDTESGISEVGLTFDKNPIVGVVNTTEGTMLINEKTGKAVTSMAPFKVGSMGMLIGGREDKPILAMFTSSNKLGNKIKKQLHDEIVDILTGFQEGKYTFEEVDKKLSSLFNGAGINNPTIFQGYSVVHNGSRIALQIGKEQSKYNLVINKFRKDSSELGTGIIYAPNGDSSKFRASIAVDKKFIEQIANEIANNVVYNKTFYTLDNINKDNTSDNPYMYKENGKFIINLGGVKTVYENFGDFALKENAFNTNQGRNEFGGFFDNADKAKSLYVDVSVVTVPDDKSSPVEGRDVSIADNIRTATTTKLNPTRDILIKAGFNNDTVNFLLGDNPSKINLILPEYGYDNKLTREFAVHRKGTILFGNAGANEANRSPKTLQRLLLHESLHAKFNEQKLFDRETIVEDLLDTYNATLEAIDNIIKTANPDSAEYANAAAIKKWLQDNKFNPTDYFTKFTKEKNEEYAKLSEAQRNRIFAEEWLVESLTQSLIMNFMNTQSYHGKEVQIEGLAEEKKTIWQKIIDLLLKLFGKGTTDVKNNTIFAQQYLILGNIDNSNTTVQEAKNENVLGDKDVGIDTTKKEEGKAITTVEEQQQAEQQQAEQQEDEEDPDFYDPSGEDVSSDTYNPDDDTIIDADNLDDLASTTTAEDFIGHVANDGDATAKTFSVTRVTNMADYLNTYAEQDKPIIAKMMANGELKFACR